MWRIHQRARLGLQLHMPRGQGGGTNRPFEYRCRVGRGLDHKQLRDVSSLFIVPESVTPENSNLCPDHTLEKEDLVHLASEALKCARASTAIPIDMGHQNDVDIIIHTAESGKTFTLNAT